MVFTRARCFKVPTIFAPSINALLPTGLTMSFGSVTFRASVGAAPHLLPPRTAHQTSPTPSAIPELMRVVCEIELPKAFPTFATLPTTSPKFLTVDAVDPMRGLSWWMLKAKNERRATTTAVNPFEEYQGLGALMMIVGLGGLGEDEM